MNNKGFTLIELLGVIVILSVIFMLVFPSATSIINQSKDTTYQKQINTILSSTYDLTLKNTNILPEKNEKVYITLSQLVKEGLIDSDIIDLKNNESFSSDLVISIFNAGANYKKLDKYSKQNGDYVYKVEFDLMNEEDYINNKPTINLENLEKNSEGNYVTNISVNETLEDIFYSATSKAGDDITDKVVINILKDGNSIENIDTKEFGLYYIIYTVVDDQGYSNFLIRNVIITDVQAPTINIPIDTVLLKSTASYNLMNDVTCEDNSGYCDVRYTGTINFGVSGKYIIEYTAKDPSGNTNTKKRVITIE